MSTWAPRQLFPLPGLSFALHSCFLSLPYSKTAVGSREMPPGASPALYQYLGAEEQHNSLLWLKEPLFPSAVLITGLLVRAVTRSSLEKAVLQLMVSYIRAENCRGEQSSLGRHLVEVFHSKPLENESKRNS